MEQTNNSKLTVFNFKQLVNVNWTTKISLDLNYQHMPKMAFLIVKISERWEIRPRPPSAGGLVLRPSPPVAKDLAPSHPSLYSFNIYYLLQLTTVFNSATVKGPANLNSTLLRPLFASCRSAPTPQCDGAIRPLSRDGGVEEHHARPNS